MTDYEAPEIQIVGDVTEDTELTTGSPVTGT